MVREPQRVLVLMADPRASLRWRDPGEVGGWRGICGPALLCGGDHANACRRIAPARPCRISALWEDHLQGFDDQLDPAVFLDRKDGDDLRASGNQNGDYSCGGGIHST